MRLVAVISAMVFVIDQVIKYLVIEVLALRSRLEIDVWDPFLNFRMAWNRGVNFGLFASDSDITRWGLVGLAIAISVFVWFWVRRELAAGRAGKALAAGAGLLIGGAMGNVVDRIVHGAVADFINMSCCGINNPFAFNVADVAIFVGALALILFSGGSGTGRVAKNG